MDVRLINREGVQRRTPQEIPALLNETGLVWIDVRYWDAEVASFLTRCLRLHERAVRDCALGSPVPKMHVYADHVFVVLHGPEPGSGGHVHHIELAQFVGPNWVLTVHGRMDPDVTLDAAYVETASVSRRLESERLRPNRPHELSAALVTALIGRMQKYFEELSHDVWTLEEQVTAGHLGNPELFLEELFAVRHGLLVIQTMATSSREVYGRMVRLNVFGAEGVGELDDLGPVPQAYCARWWSARVSSWSYQILPDQNRYQDDDRCRAARCDCSGHPPDCSSLVDIRDECHCSRSDGCRPAPACPSRNARHVRHFAGLDSPQGLVVGK